MVCDVLLPHLQCSKDLEKKKTATRGFGNRAEAMTTIAAARMRLAGTLHDG